MSLTQTLISAVLVITIIAWISCAVMTVIPDQSTSKDCYLGYRAHCSFTPYGTIISVAACLVTLFIAQNFGYLKIF